MRRRGFEAESRRPKTGVCATLADGWEEILLPEIERQRQNGKEVVFRGDAAFAKPEIYEALEERGVKYAIRIPANDSPERDIAELLPRPVAVTPCWLLSGRR